MMPGGVRDAEKVARPGSGRGMCRSRGPHFGGWARWRETRSEVVDVGLLVASEEVDGAVRGLSGERARHGFPAREEMVESMICFHCAAKRRLRVPFAVEEVGRGRPDIAGRDLG